MMGHQSFFTRRLFGAPLALHPQRADIARYGLSSDFEDMPPPGALSQGAGYAVIQGVAVIQLHGLLVHRLGCIGPWNGMTGFDGIRAALLNVASDRAIRAIALDIDSPGGELSGLFDLADTISACGASKPIWAMLNEDALAGAYVLASACDQVSVPRTGSTGSIGVVALFPDISKALNQAGVKVTVFQFGDRKADGTPELPLTGDAATRFQAEVDKLGALMVETVARNRKLSTAKVTAQQAGTYLGRDGVTAGLADLVAAPDVAMGALLDELRPARQAQLGGRV